MKILALILARGGSKRLPGKNIRQLGGKPLIAWSIILAGKFDKISHVLVSTDSPEIAAVARAEGALVPWLRPAHLSTDSVSSFDAAIHSLNWYEAEHGQIGGLLLLQPTSPFRGFETVKRALDMFQSDPLRPVVSMSAVHPHPAWSFMLEKGELIPALGWNELRQRAQDLAPAYTLNGAIYLIAADALRKSGSFVTENLQPLLMEDEMKALDIDTEWDWIIAEEVLKRGVEEPLW